MKADSLNGPPTGVHHEADSLSGPLMCVRPFHWMTVNTKSQGPVNIKDPACPMQGPSKTQLRHRGRCPRACGHFLSV